MNHHFSLFGMAFRSTVPLPHAPPDDALPNDALLKDAEAVMLRYGPVPAHLPGAVRAGWGQQVTPDAVLVPGRDGGRLLVEHGRHVWVDADGAPDEALAPYLMGSVMGALLYQRGALPLHGSAVAVGDGAVVFLGRRGAGKSTLAALLHRRGYPVLAGDLSAVTWRDGRPLVHAGPPLLKLCPDALEALGEVPDDHPPVPANPAKHQYRLRADHPLAPRPVHAVYVLGTGAAVGASCFEPLSAVRALPLVRRFSYRPDLLPGMGRVRAHFLLCARLLQHASARRLWRPAAWHGTEAFLDAVEADLARLAEVPA